MLRVSLLFGVFFSTLLAYKPGTGPIRMSDLASLPESARKIALDRFRLLQLHLEEQRLLKAVAREGGVGYRTAQPWKMRYRKYGLTGLARDDRSDRGRWRVITAELKQILEALALQKPPLPIAPRSPSDNHSTHQPQSRFESVFASD
jgi:putative transposase